MFVIFRVFRGEKNLNEIGIASSRRGGRPDKNGKQSKPTAGMSLNTADHRNPALMPLARLINQRYCVEYSAREIE